MQTSELCEKERKIRGGRVSWGFPSLMFCAVSVDVKQH